MSGSIASAIFAHAHEPLFVVDTAGVVREVSLGAARLVGRSRAAIAGTRFEALLDAAEGATPGLVESLHRDDGAAAELPFSVDEGPAAWVALRSHRLENGQFLIVGRDMRGARISGEFGAAEFAMVADQLPGVAWTTDRALTVTSIVGGGLAMRNRLREDLIGRSIQDYFGSADPSFFPVRAHYEALRGHAAHYEFERGGHRFQVRLNPLHAPDGSVRGVIGLALEITESSKLVQRLMTAQREQTLGRLAGSMAHEFNNLLTVISAHAALVADQIADPATREDLLAVQEASRKGRGLTARLLSFTRRQIQQPERVRIDRLLEDLEPMLRAMVGGGRRFVLDVDPEVGWVRIDPALLERVVLNLVDNAMDATGDRGIITVTAAADENGQVRLVVRDDGVGMDEHVRARACEPFFTTKPPGRGTGLGLATAVSVLTDAAGNLSIASAPGRGTTVTMTLPRAKAPSGNFARQRSCAPSETVLLVEDQLGVRRATRRILRREGYQVFEAANAEEALAVATTYSATIHLLLTDVVMPGMSGPQVAEVLVGQRPTLKVLYMSGYAEDVEEVRAAVGRGQVFLAKPFTPEQLLERVRRALAGVTETEEER